MSLSKVGIGVLELSKWSFIIVLLKWFLLLVVLTFI
jgi:hypothetical protein